MNRPARVGSLCIATTSRRPVCGRRMSKPGNWRCGWSLSPSNPIGLLDPTPIRISPDCQSYTHPPAQLCPPSRVEIYSLSNWYKLSVRSIHAMDVNEKLVAHTVDIGAATAAKQTAKR